MGVVLHHHRRPRPAQHAVLVALTDRHRELHALTLVRDFELDCESSLLVCAVALRSLSQARANVHTECLRGHDPLPGELGLLRLGNPERMSAPDLAI